MKHLLILTAAALLGPLAARPALAWWGDGHGLLAEAAVLALPQEMPAFFRAGAGQVAHVSYDQDLFKNRSVPQLLGTEHPEHFFDAELVEGMALPEDRFGFVAACQKVDLEPQKVGFLPYTLVEWTQRLAVAFAEYRRWPADETVQAKALVYAGFLAHYAADASQPLHLTIHFDGRIEADGTVVGRGIHEKVDGLVQAIGFAPEELAAVTAINLVDPLLPGILAEFERSRGLLDLTYELAPDLEDHSRAEVQAFARERAAAATGFIASLFVTAWHLSEQIELPGWHHR